MGTDRLFVTQRRQQAEPDTVRGSKWLRALPGGDYMGWVGFDMLVLMAVGRACAGWQMCVRRPDWDGNGWAVPTAVGNCEWRKKH